MPPDAAMILATGCPPTALAAREILADRAAYHDSRWDNGMTDVE